MDLHPNNVQVSNWPHRWAILLACATFPLIWVGGLVTTYDAGMAVPDWPTTYGDNLFLYPVSTWLAGPWDLFIEHGHRLLGSLVGLMTICFVITAWRCEPRRWMRWAVLAALALVIFQGLLGGQRVLLNSRQIARIHGIVGPTFFAYCVFLTAASSRWWRERRPVQGLGDYAISAWMILGLAFLQLVLGSQLRHVDTFTSAGTFSACVMFHVSTAVLVMGMGCATSISAGRQFRSAPAVRRVAVLLGSITVLQVLLGVATWIAKYGWPSVATRFGLEAAVVVQAQSMVQATIVTAHVATGALILGLSVLWVARVSRLSFAAHEVQVRSHTERSRNSGRQIEFVSGGLG